MNVHLILGAPGCGKTTRLLAIIDEALEQGMAPEQIAYVSFTRKAANEAITRAQEKFGFDKKQIPFFRTLHSLAYSMLGLSRQEILTDYSSIASATGFNLKIRSNVTTHLPSGSGEHGEVAFIEALARNKEHALRQEWELWQQENRDSKLPWHILKYYADTLTNYKQSQGLLDYTDILQLFVDQELVAPVKLFIVDEAQDLSRLQWAVIEHASKKAERIIVAGDDDQAIYEWSGADVNYFLGLKGTQEVLEQSWRLPKKVYNFAGELSGRIKKRYDKNWNPREEHGIVERKYYMDQLPLEDSMLLTRNNYQLNEIKEHLFDKGYFYNTNNGFCIEEEYLTAIKYWEHLRKGSTLKSGQINVMVKLMKEGQALSRGAKQKLLRLNPNEEYALGDLQQLGLVNTAIWHEVLTAIPQNKTDYIIRCLSNGQKLDTQLYVGTIHSVKGGEADNVILFPDLSYRNYTSLKRSPDAEHRVWYVGATRARQALYLMEPRGKFYYSM